MSSSTTPARVLRKQSAADLYRTDGYSWSVQQADALRRRDFAAVDWDNVIEEIESVGKAEKREWRAYCARVIEHLLKIEHYDEATEKVLHHWSEEIADFRQKMARLIKDNPGLQGEYDTMYAEAWEDGRDYACRRLAEYDHSNDSSLTKKQARLGRDRSLPQQCPYRLEDVTAFELRRDTVPNHDVWPASVVRMLNDRLGESYPVRHERTQEQEFDWGR